MKRSGHIASTGAEQARQQLPAILDAAIAGRPTIITRRGREVAVVIPIAGARLSQPASLMALAGSGRGLWGTRSATTVARLRDEWKR